MAISTAAFWSSSAVGGGRLIRVLSAALPFPGTHDDVISAANRSGMWDWDRLSSCAGIDWLGSPTAAVHLGDRHGQEWPFRERPDVETIALQPPGFKPDHKISKPPDAVVRSPKRDPIKWTENAALFMAAGAVQIERAS